MDLFLVITILVVVSAVYSFLNARYIRLPGSIGIVTIAIIVSVIAIVTDKLYPPVSKHFTMIADRINFTSAILNIMLGFLLFAGSFNSNTNRLKQAVRPVAVLSTLGVILSTIAFGSLFYYGAMAFKISIPFIYCLLFGALISPTDPVSVASIIKNSKLSPELSTIIKGESLFNDGVGLVLFVTILEAIHSGSAQVELGSTIFLFIKEVFGGIILGVAIGLIGHRAMKAVTDFQTIVLISLSMVLSLSAIASALHFSIPLAAVSAGLFVGNRTINQDGSERSHEALEKFWKLIDEMLNTILFVMIGLQIVNLPYIANYWLAGVMGIVLILVARWISIFFPWIFLREKLHIRFQHINLLTWSGVRGGISIALALSLPAGPYRHLILCASYFIVIFSVIIQGLTLNYIIDKTLNGAKEK